MRDILEAIQGESLTLQKSLPLLRVYSSKEDFSFCMCSCHFTFSENSFQKLENKITYFSSCKICCYECMGHSSFSKNISRWED